MRLPDFCAWLPAGQKSRGRSAQRRPFRPRLQFFLGSTAVALTAVLISMLVGVFQTQSPLSEGASLGALAAPQESSWPCYMAAERRTRGCTYKITKDACLMKYTFIVNIVDAIKRVHMCTGVVFGPRTVLAPAYCVDKKVNPAADAFPLVRINSYHLNGTEGQEEVEVLVPTCRRILHSDFTGNPSHGRDIALLILQRAICCHTSPIRSIPLGQCKEENLATFGWFADERGLPSSDLEVLVNPWPMDCDACKAQLKELPEGVLCTARQHTTGLLWDLGAPLMCNDTYLVGIASYKIPVSQLPKGGGKVPQLPAVVYTDIEAHKEWIDREGVGARTIEDSSDKKCRI